MKKILIAVLLAFSLSAGATKLPGVLDYRLVVWSPAGEEMMAWSHKYMPLEKCEEAAKELRLTTHPAYPITCEQASTF